MKLDQATYLRLRRLAHMELADDTWTRVRVAQGDLLALVEAFERVWEILEHCEMNGGEGDYTEITEALYGEDGRTPRIHLGGA